MVFVANEKKKKRKKRKTEWVHCAKEEKCVHTIFEEEHTTLLVSRQIGKKHSVQFTEFTANLNEQEKYKWTKKNLKKEKIVQDYL
jgi:hypothetical protein